MKRTVAVIAVLALVWLPASAMAQYDAAPWNDNFDSYTTGTVLIDVDYWDGWYDDPASAGTVSSAQRMTVPNAIEVSNSTGIDAVHPFRGVDAGAWVLTAWQFVPSDLDGLTYFIVNNEYDHVLASADWAIETHMDPATGLVNEQIHDPGGAGALPLITDRWVEIRTEIDLDNNYMHQYYDGELLAEGVWNIRLGGLIEIQNIDLYAPHDVSVFYDNLSLLPEPASCLLLAVGAVLGLRRR
jgi:hypothetical protein